MPDRRRVVHEAGEHVAGPEEARELMAFLLSERLEKLLVLSDSHNFPTHPTLAKEFEEYIIPKPLERKRAGL